MCGIRCSNSSPPGGFCSLRSSAAMCEIPARMRATPRTGTFVRNRMRITSITMRPSNSRGEQPPCGRAGWKVNRSSQIAAPHPAGKRGGRSLDRLVRNHYRPIRPMSKCRKYEVGKSFEAACRDIVRAHNSGPRVTLPQQAAAFLLFLLMLCAAFAQSATGPIVGTARDTGGAILRGVGVEIRNDATSPFAPLRESPARHSQRNRPRKPGCPVFSRTTARNGSEL